MIKPWPWENMDERSGQRAQREHRQKAAFVGGTRPSPAVQGRGVGDRVQKMRLRKEAGACSGTICSLC